MVYEKQDFGKTCFREIAIREVGNWGIWKNEFWGIRFGIFFFWRVTFKLILVLNIIFYRFIRSIPITNIPNQQLQMQCELVKGGKCQKWFFTGDKKLSEMYKYFFFLKNKQCRLKIWVLFEWSLKKIENFRFFIDYGQNFLAPNLGCRCQVIFLFWELSACDK